MCKLVKTKIPKMDVDFVKRYFQNQGSRINILSAMSLANCHVEYRIQVAASNSGHKESGHTARDQLLRQDVPAR